MLAQKQVWAEKRLAEGKKYHADRSGAGFFGFVFCLLVFLCSGLVFAADKDDKTSPPRYRVFSLRHISAEQGKEYLTQLGIGTVSILPSPNTLLVTASAAELVKASVLLEVVDANQQYVIKSIRAVSEGEKIPSAEKIASKVGDISVGTFTVLPERGSKAMAIIDVHNGKLLAIAPAEEIEKITAVIEQVRNEEIGLLQPAKPSESNEPNQPLQPSEPNQSMMSTIPKGTAPAQQPEPNQLSQSKAEGTTPTKLQEISDSNKPVQQAGEQQVKSNKPDELDLLDKFTETKAATEPNKGETVVSVPEPNEGKTVAAEPNKVKAVTDATEPNEEKAVMAEPNKPAVSTAQPQKKEPAEPLAGSEKAKKQPADQPQESKDKAAVEGAQPPSAEPQTKQEANEAEESSAAESENIQGLSYEPAPLPIGEEELTLDLPEKLNIIDLLDLVGKYLKLNYMYDPAKITGEVTLKLQGPIKVKQLYPLAESVLKFRNFVMTRKGNLVTIVPTGEVLDIDPTLMYGEKGKVEYGDVIVTRLFNLRYIDTTSAMAFLNQMKLGANITEIKDASTLIVTDYAYRMGRIEELLGIVDKPGAPKQFKSRQLKYTMAKILAPKIKSLVEQLGTMSITIAQPAVPPQAERGRRAAPQPAQPARPAPTPQTAKPSVYLDTDDRTNRILMIGFENELDTVDELIDALDVQQQDLRTLRIYDIQYVDAQEVRSKLQELGIISGGGAAPSGRAEAAKTAAPATAPATAPAAAPSTGPVSGGLVEEPQVVIIASTNSLLVNATPEQHVQIAMIIGYVDSRTLEEAIPYEIYPLENQDPKDLAEVLQKLIQETIKDKEGKIQQVIKKQEDIEIVPDEKTFSMIVYASRKNQEWIKKLITQLDKRRPQVLIDVTLVEITNVDAFNLDLQLVSKLPEMAAGGTMQSTISALLSPFPSGTVKEVASNPATTGLQGFYSDSHIQALLTAMESKTYGRVLAKPKILVNDGESGTIKTTNTTNVQVQSSIVPNQGTAVTNTSYTAYTAGITLTIKPNISEGDLLLLNVAMDRTDFVAGAQANYPPNSRGSNVATVVTVPNDRTIILGGMMTLNQTKGVSKVPLLGDIPIIGVLFRSTTSGTTPGTTDSKLYIFVKANILRPQEVLGKLKLPELESISDLSKKAFEKSEDKFQSYESLPGTKSKPLYPTKVLEEE